MATRPVSKSPQRSVYRPEYKQFINVLRMFRERTGLNQTQFAEVLGRNQSYVSGVERGAKIDALQVRDWCVACGMDLVSWAKEVEKSLKAGG